MNTKKIQVACSQNPTRKYCITTLFHAYILKILRVFRQLRKRFKTVFEFMIFEDFWKICRIFDKYLKIQKVLKFSENLESVRKRLKTVFQEFYDFLRFSENLRKFSKKIRKRFKNVSRGRDRDCSETFAKVEKIRR